MQAAGSYLLDPPGMSWFFDKKIIVRKNRILWFLDEKKSKQTRFYGKEIAWRAYLKVYV